MKKELKRMTVDELRQFKGFENYSELQAKKTIQTLEILSMLFYELHLKHQSSKTIQSSMTE